MDMIRSWNRCVCTTHPRSTVAPSPSVTRSASGSQYDSHHTPRPILAPSPRSQMFIRQYPSRHARTTARRRSRRRRRTPRCATRTSSTAGARSCAIRPTTNHFAAHGDRARHRARDQQDHAAETEPRPVSDGLGDQLRARTARRVRCRRSPSPGSGGTSPRRPRAIFSRSGGSKVREASAVSGRAAQPHRRATQPRRARLRLGRSGRQHRDEAVLRHASTRARSSRSCRGTRACRPWRRSMCIQPPPSS